MLLHFKILSLGIISLMAATSATAADKIMIGDFSNGNLQEWRSESFVGKTRYTIASQNDKKVLRAVSSNAASGLVRKIDIDLNKTPYLHWDWKVENTLNNTRERFKDGDDYPARVYVIISGGIFFWNTRAANYVWSSHQSAGSTWPNAYTGNAKMLAVESGDTNIGQWIHESRNVKQDLREMFDEDIDEINAVAIMTDTDNTGQTATAFYGDIYFSNQ
jgi:hypothetical protein